MSAPQPPGATVPEVNFGPDERIQTTRLAAVGGVVAWAGTVLPAALSRHRSEVPLVWWVLAVVILVAATIVFRESREETDEPFPDPAGSLLLLDIVRAGVEPGTVLVLQGDDIPRLLSLKLSPHQVDVRELLALASLRDSLPQRIALVGVQARHVDLSTDISPEVLAALPAMRAHAVEMLAAWGHRVA